MSNLNAHVRRETPIEDAPTEEIVWRREEVEALRAELQSKEAAIEAARDTIAQRGRMIFSIRERCHSMMQTLREILEMTK